MDHQQQSTEQEHQLPLSSWGHAITGAGCTGTVGWFVDACKHNWVINSTLLRNNQIINMTPTTSMRVGVKALVAILVLVIHSHVTVIQQSLTVKLLSQGYLWPLSLHPGNHTRDAPLCCQP